MSHIVSSDMDIMETSLFLYPKTVGASKRRVLSHISASIGPQIHLSLISCCREKKITTLNLHFNKIYSFIISIDGASMGSVPIISQDNIESLNVLDISSNCLGDKSVTTLHEGPSFLSLTPNLQVMNLSSNNLTCDTMSEAFSSITLLNLRELNISHNSLRQLPSNFSDIFPCIEKLNLISNQFASFPHLCRPLHRTKAKIFELHLRDNTDSNPLCFKHCYRQRIICFLTNLKDLDGTLIVDSDRETARDKVYLDLMDHEKEDEQAQDLHENCYTDIRQNSDKGKVHKYQKRDIEKRRLSTKPKTTKGSKCRHHTINETNGNIDTKCRADDRLLRAGQKMSLHKVTKLENKLQILSDVVEKQVLTTEKLIQITKSKKNQLDSNHDDNNVSRFKANSDKNNEERSVTDIECMKKDENEFCDAETQTKLCISDDMALETIPINAYSTNICKKNHKSSQECGFEKDLTYYFQKWQLQVTKSKLLEIEKKYNILKTKSTHEIQLNDECRFDQENDVKCSKEYASYIIDIQSTIEGIYGYITVLEEELERYMSVIKLIKVEHRKDMSAFRKKYEIELGKILQSYTNEFESTMNEERTKQILNVRSLKDKHQKLFEKEVAEKDKIQKEMGEKEQALCDEILQRKQLESYINKLRKEMNEAKECRDSVLNEFNKEVEKVKKLVREIYRRTYSNNVSIFNDN